MLESEEVKQMPLWTRILLSILHGFFGFVLGAVMLVHGCERGNKLFEGVMPFVLMVISFLIVFQSKMKYRYSFLISLGVYILFFVFAIIYGDLTH